MRNRIRTILAILLAAVFLLTGCRIFKKDVHTVLTLTNAALTNVAEVESAEVKIRGTGDLNATYEALNIGLNMKLGTDMDLEMTRKPERTRGTAAITIGAIGQEQVIDGVLYKDTAGDGTKTTYVQWQGGDWLKRTSAPAEQTEEKKGFTVPSSLVQTVGIMKAIAEGGISAELQEETVMVNESFSVSSWIKAASAWADSPSIRRTSTGQALRCPRRSIFIRRRNCLPGSPWTAPRSGRR